MARQKYIPLFDDQLEVISFLSDAQLGSAVRAAMGFVRYGTEPALDGITGMFYQVLRAQYLRQLGAQQDGAMGGRPRIEKTGKEIEKENREETTPLFREETSVPLRRDKKIRNKLKEDSLSHSSAKPPRLSDEDFETFWTAYPRKDSKAQARKAFAKVNAPLETLLCAVAAQREGEQWRRDGGQFIPYASTWLNQRRWEDEAPAQQVDNAESVGWQRENPDLLDQSTWILGADGISRPPGVTA